MGSRALTSARDRGELNRNLGISGFGEVASSNPGLPLVGFSKEIEGDILQTSRRRGAHVVVRTSATGGELGTVA